MKHLTIMKICDLLQDTRNRMLELSEYEDSDIVELLYQKYIKLYHEHLRR